MHWKQLISFRSVFYGNMVDTDFFLNHALLYSFTNFRDTSDSHQLHVFLFSYKLPTCLFLGHSTARYGKIGLWVSFCYLNFWPMLQLMIGNQHFDVLFSLISKSFCKQCVKTYFSLHLQCRFYLVDSFWCIDMLSNMVKVIICGATPDIV